MSYDEVEIEDMKWDEQLQAYTYSCPCGDLFQITLVSQICGCCLFQCGFSVRFSSQHDLDQHCS
jgi:diphthamide biosynthesis protein 3